MASMPLPLIMAIIAGTKSSKGWRGRGEKGALVGGRRAWELVRPPLETARHFLKKHRVNCRMKQQFLSSVCVSQETKTSNSKPYIHPRLPEALFTVIKKGNEAILLSHKQNEILTYLSAWMDLAGPTLEKADRGTWAPWEAGEVEPQRCRSRDAGNKGGSPSGERGAGVKQAKGGKK